MRYTAIVTGLGAVLLAGCSDPRKASEGNFRRAIDTHFAKTRACINLPRGDVRRSDAKSSGLPILFAVNSRDGDWMGGSREEADALVAAGLLRAQVTTVQNEGVGGHDDTIAVKAYDLTEKGKAALGQPQEGTEHPDAQDARQLCYGIPTVIEITQFTQPADLFGMTASHVAYTWRIDDPADWARDPHLLKAFPEMRNATARSLDGRTDLVLTNKGWTDVKDAKL